MPYPHDLSITFYCPPEEFDEGNETTQANTPTSLCDETSSDEDNNGSDDQHPIDEVKAADRTKLVLVNISVKRSSDKNNMGCLRYTKTWWCSSSHNEHSNTEKFDLSFSNLFVVDTDDDEEGTEDETIGTTILTRGSGREPPRYPYMELLIDKEGVPKGEKRRASEVQDRNEVRFPKRRKLESETTDSGCKRRYVNNIDIVTTANVVLRIDD